MGDNHQELDQKTTRIIYQCEVCNFSTHFSYSMANHQRNVHKPSVYLCKLCKQFCITEEDIADHLQRAHEVSVDANNMRKFAQESSGHNSQRGMCVETEEEGQRVPSAKCNSCKAVFITKHLLDKHTCHAAEDTAINGEYKVRKRTRRAPGVGRTGKDKSVYKCDICGYTSPYNACKSTHLRKHMEYKYECSVCKWPGKSEAAVYIHRKTTHGNKQRDTNKAKGGKIRNYQCDICSYSTGCSSNLLCHRDKHERCQYHCQVCNMPFRTENILHIHLVKIHNAVVSAGKVRMFVVENPKDYVQDGSRLEVNEGTKSKSVKKELDVIDQSVNREVTKRKNIASFDEETLQEWSDEDAQELGENQHVDILPKIGIGECDNHITDNVCSSQNDETLRYSDDIKDNTADLTSQATATDELCGDYRTNCDAGFVKKRVTLGAHSKSKRTMEGARRQTESDHAFGLTAKTLYHRETSEHNFRFQSQEHSSDTVPSIEIINSSMRKNLHMDLHLSDTDEENCITYENGEIGEQTLPMKQGELLKCPQCTYETKDLEFMQLHSTMHRADKYECSICKKQFRFQLVLERHVRKRHQSVHRTDGTEPAFVSGSHVPSTSDNSERKRCTVCGYETKSLRKFTRHLGKCHHAEPISSYHQNRSEEGHGATLSNI